MEVRFFILSLSINGASFTYLPLVLTSLFSDPLSLALCLLVGVGIIRSPEGRSPREPLKPLLPLDLSSSDFEIDLLFKIVSTSSSSSIGGIANVTLSQHAQHANLALDSLNLRVYPHGWQHLVECVQNYEDFKVQAVGRVAEASAGWTQLGVLLSGEEEVSPSPPPLLPSPADLVAEEKSAHPAI
jgi:hypothetical protein